MGAFALLSDLKQARAVEIVVDEVRGRVPVLAGAADTGTRRVIDKARQMASLGADYLTILPPFYFGLDAESIRRFYREIADAVPLPVFIYDNPATTKYSIPLETVFELSDIPNIAGIKESDQDCQRWQGLISRFRDHPNFTVLIGTEGLFKLAMMMGADGVVAGLHNLAPAMAVKLYRSVVSGDFEEADRLQQRLIDLFAIFTCGAGIWGAFEIALQSLGICEKVTASPYDSPVDKTVRERVEAILKTTLEIQDEAAPRGKFIEAPRSASPVNN